MSALDVPSEVAFPFLLFPSSRVSSGNAESDRHLNRMLSLSSALAKTYDRVANARKQTSSTFVAEWAARGEAEYNARKEAS